MRDVLPSGHFGDLVRVGGGEVMTWSRSQLKYGNKKVEHAGRRFDSKLEKAVFDVLILQERAGEIKDIQQQVSVYLTAARILYKPDFSVFDLRSMQIKYVEAKGLSTPVFAIKKRLWKYYGPGPLEVWKTTGRGIYLDEVVIPVGRGEE